MRTRIIRLIIMALLISLAVPVASVNATNVNSCVLPVPAVSPPLQACVLSFPSGSTDIYVDMNNLTLPSGITQSTLDRLYIPEGVYTKISLVNLPQRTSARPLVITNYGGQVKVSSTAGDQGIIASGGKHWVLTGKYDTGAKTGHSGYVGHSNGAYADSSGTYGIEVNKVGDSGIKVSNATNFELSHIEVANVGFAGLLIKTDGQPNATMDGVKIHDMYIHDSESEGVYIGNTSKTPNSQHKFTNLEFYNNRIVRSGTEGLQLSHMGNGTKVHNNVVFLSAISWKNPFQNWQDGSFQLYVRDGNVEVYDNLFIGGGQKLFDVQFMASTAEQPAAGELYMHDNYFSHSRGFFSYVFNDSTNYGSGIRFENNTIREINFHYTEVNSGYANPNALVRTSPNTTNPAQYNNNSWSGPQGFIDVLNTTNKANGTSSNVTASGNQKQTSIAPVAFMDTTFPVSFDWSLIEYWHPASKYPGITITYNVGDYVVYNGKIFRCVTTHTGSTGSTPGASSKWVEEDWPTDDLRLTATSPFQGLGLNDAGGTPEEPEEPEEPNNPGTLQLIVPTAAGPAGSNWFPLQNAFEGTVAYNPTTGALSGGSGGEFAPYYQDRYGYIDFGPNWADVRISQTWTKYRASSTGNMTPYDTLWWDDDKNDTTSASELLETRINFNTKQGLSSNMTTEPWYADTADMTAVPVTPKARYLILHSPSNMNSRALEYAIVGWIDD
ncbi:right-handed parallel beta-helix repeat-containing protein [Cohnella sp. GCM10027633]|uniref:right-handed parallel beta-helix repeat-containing protein n=1 Tax=unclassified Cohnella TaxID=2636738 RepID=UPI003629BC22